MSAARLETVKESLIADLQTYSDSIGGKSRFALLFGSGSDGKAWADRQIAAIPHMNAFQIGALMSESVGSERQKILANAALKLVGVAETTAWTQSAVLSLVKQDIFKFMKQNSDARRTMPEYSFSRIKASSVLETAWAASLSVHAATPSI